MSGAFAVGLRTLFNDPNMSVSGVYTPAGGSPVDVRVVFVRKADLIASGALVPGVTAPENSAELLQSEVPIQPRNGATLAFGGQTFGIRSVGQPQRRGLTWRVVLSDG